MPFATRRGLRKGAALTGGGCAEEVVVRADSVTRIPERLGTEEAAATPEVYLTVFLDVFQRGKLEEGGGRWPRGAAHPDRPQGAPGPR